MLLALGERSLATVHGDFRAHVFRNLATRSFVLAVARGDVSGPVPELARVHSSCVTSETFGACDCDCAQQLDSALARIAKAGRGVVFYLLQEGRGAGFAAKARDRMIVQASRDRVTTFEAYERLGLGRDYRRYGDISSVRHLLGIDAPLELLTNNPEKLAALDLERVPVHGTVPIRHEASPWNVHYLAAKSRSGHALAEPDAAMRPAELPEPVRYFDPIALEDAPRFVHVASYFLPIEVGDAGAPPHWFALHAYHDLRLGLERVVLVHAARKGATPLVRVQRESLLERFPLRGAGHRRAQWRATVKRIVERGAGVVLFLPIAGSSSELGPGDAQPGGNVEGDGTLGREVLRLLQRHLPEGPAQPLLDASGESRDDTALCEFLVAEGVALSTSLRLGADAA
jgi:3,4-dihydroxy 2-butanone 4-phosphate synthase/GTP cyclohydrolase II